MAVGKNKKLNKRGKGGKKKAVNPFTKKEWYTIRAPGIFTKRDCGKTLVTRTQGTKIASEQLKGRIFEVSIADLNDKAEEEAYRKIKLRCEDVQGYNVLTNFYGMDLTRDKLCSLIKKWQSTIEARVDVRTTDGYTLRMFCIGFTTKRPNQVKKTCYAQAEQERQIRKKMVELMTQEATKDDLQALVKLFLHETIGQEIQKACQGIFPLQNCFVRKVKILKAPKFDLTKLMELHGDNPDEVGAKIDRENIEKSEITKLEGSGGRL